MAVVGYQNIGANSFDISTSTHDNPVGLKVSLSEENTVSKVSIAIKKTTDTHNAVAKIYSDNAGQRGNLLFTSNAVAISNTTYSFIDFTFASTPTLSAGTYWLEAQDSTGSQGPGTTGLQVAYDIGGGANSSYFVNDVGVPVYGTDQYSINATVTPTNTSISWSVALI